MPTKVQEAHQEAAAEPKGDSKLLATLVGLMEAMQSPGKEGRGQSRKIPKALEKFKLVPNPVWGQCWYCGEMNSERRVYTCLTRIQHEKENPGSSLVNQENQ